MRVRVLAFARLRELLGWSGREIDLPDGASGADLWSLLAGTTPAIADLHASTRVAYNGRLGDYAHGLRDGDEVALLPPAGGG